MSGILVRTDEPGDACNAPGSGQHGGADVTERMSPGDDQAKPRLKSKTWFACIVDGCDNKGEGYRLRAGLCAKHYGRMERHGHTGLHVPPYRVTDKISGYVRVSVPDHPLRSGHTTYVWEHRVVLFDHLGPDAHPCHWCARQLQWDAHRYAPSKLEVDHLDRNRANNALANLVPACHGCNSGAARKRRAA